MSLRNRISIQTLLFQACLPTRQNGVENRDKAYFSRVPVNNDLNCNLTLWYLNHYSLASFLYVQKQFPRFPRISVKPLTFLWY